MITVISMNALKSIANPDSSEVYYLAGYYTPGDGGGGEFYWDPAATDTVDNGVIVLKNNTTSATPGRWKRIYSGAVNVKWFGAKGGAVGTYDDTGAITNALTYYSNVYFPKGTYIITNRISVAHDINIDFAMDAVIDATAVQTTSSIFTFAGSLEAEQTITLPAAKGENELHASLSVVKGDILKLQSPDLWNTYREYYFKGELVQVNAAVPEPNGTKIITTVPLYDSYGLNCKIQRVNAIRVTLNGFRLKHNNDIIGISIYWCTDVSLYACEISGTNKRALDIIECYRVNVINCKTDCDFVAGGNTNYGLVISSCQNVLVSGGSYRAGRHGIAFGGTIPFRNCRVENLIVMNDPQSGSYCLDTHGNGEYIEFVNVTSTNGALLQSKDTKILGGTYNSFNYPTCIFFNPEVEGGSYIIDNVTGENLHDNAFAIFSTVKNPAHYDLVSFTNISCRVKGTGTYNYSFLLADTGGAEPIHIDKINFQNIQCAHTDDATVVSHMLYVGRNSDKIGTKLLSIQNVNLSCTGNNWDAFYVRLATGHINITDSVFAAKSAASVGGQIISYGAATASLYNNIWDLQQTSVYFFFYNCNSIELQGGSTRNSNSVGLRFDKIGYLLLSDHRFVNVTGSTPLISNVDRFVNGITQHGNQLLFAAAPPATGTWKAGDIVYNKDANTGLPVQWICTAGGTPGTWIKEGIAG